MRRQEKEWILSCTVVAKRMEDVVATFVDEACCHRSTREGEEQREGACRGWTAVECQRDERRALLALGS